MYSLALKPGGKYRVLRGKASAVAKRPPRPQHTFDPSPQSNRISQITNLPSLDFNWVPTPLIKCGQKGHFFIFGDSHSSFFGCKYLITISQKNSVSTVSPVATVSF
jgi:hypothetical protein